MTNGFDLPSNQWDVTRREPVLTASQLSQIVTQPWWALQMPREYQVAGERLSPYTELGDQTGWVPGDSTTGDGSVATPSGGPSPR